jgi:uncharacterized protein (TIGR03435 family)
VRPGFFCFVTLFAATMSAQVPAQPKFEVVSIKECPDGSAPPPSTASPGRVSLSCWPLWRLIGDAYDTFATGAVDPLKQPVPRPPEGGPTWIHSVRYTIDAKAESPQTGAMMRGPMMQAVLEDRFRLKIHTETREVDGYVMTVDKQGLKLHRTGEGACNHLDPTDLGQSPTPANGKPWCVVPQVTRKDPLTTLDIRGITLDGFARLLHPDRLPVFDRTGVSGAFDIHLEWGPDVPNVETQENNAASVGSHMSVMQATRQQLGLRLQRGKGSSEFLVVDHLERPSHN